MDALVSLDVKNIYELSGKILVVPIKSNGDASINLSKYDLRAMNRYMYIFSTIIQSILKFGWYEFIPYLYRMKNLQQLNIEMYFYRYINGKEDSMIN